MHLHCAQAGEKGERVMILCPGKAPFNDDDFVCGDDDVMNQDEPNTIHRWGDFEQMCNGVKINNLASLYQAMRDGMIYWNAHTVGFPDGEIRGQIFTL